MREKFMELRGQCTAQLTRGLGYTTSSLRALNNNKKVIFMKFKILTHRRRKLEDSIRSGLLFEYYLDTQY